MKLSPRYYICRHPGRRARWSDRPVIRGTCRWGETRMRKLSNCIHVPLRLGFGTERKNWAASYRERREAVRVELPEDGEAHLPWIPKLDSRSSRNPEVCFAPRFGGHPPRSGPFGVRPAAAEAPRFVCGSRVGWKFEHSMSLGNAAMNTNPASFMGERSPAHSVSCGNA
jgi:hypothetical protein